MTDQVPRNLKWLNKQTILIERNAETTNFSMTPVGGDDIYYYQATMRGPDDSPFEGGLYLFDIQFDISTPFKPPKMRLLTKIFHPNIGNDGTIFIDLLYNSWSPALTVEKILLSMQSLLITPDTDASMTGNKEAASLYMQDRGRYDQRVRFYTQKYAV